MVKLYSDTFEWRFARPPEEIWQALADTARWNEAAGLPKHAIEEVLQPHGSVRFFGRGRQGMFAYEWEEIPVEWVDRQWFRHLRVYSNGHIRTICATLRLSSDDAGGTIAHYTAEATAANLFGTFILETVFLRASRRILRSSPMACGIGRKVDANNHSTQSARRYRLRNVRASMPWLHGLRKAQTGINLFAVCWIGCWARRKSIL